ncbi:helix-turn-helix domain-containing protein [Rubellimicrobium roseum]|uniref:helix-turn-helix domain-containing protein n=1 Tax=Rubellimicrobium roseum TaxID=687525 RepID=UPI00159BE7F0|nr:helix-turn-helix transcriptional regulator [Rubellimicrobium roseum]
MTGAELRAHRRAAGLSQVELARQAGVTRDTVRYWEAKLRVNLHQMAPQRFMEVLGLGGLRNANARARGWGLTQNDPIPAYIATRMAAAAARQKAREAERAARAHVPCGARTRKGHPCRLLSEPGQRRCKFHGGKSTGPTTPEGRARIAEAQRRRWAAWRAAKAAEPDA